MSHLQPSSVTMHYQPSAVLLRGLEANTEGQLPTLCESTSHLGFPDAEMLYLLRLKNQTSLTGLLDEHSQSSSLVGLGTSLPYSKSCPHKRLTRLPSSLPSSSKETPFVCQGSCEFQPPRELFSLQPTCRFLSHPHTHTGDVHKRACQQLRGTCPNKTLTLVLRP